MSKKLFVKLWFFFIATVFPPAELSGFTRNTVMMPLKK